MSGQFSYLYSYSDGCTPEVDDRMVCTSVSLSAAERPDGPDSLYVSVYEYVLDKGEYAGSSYE